MERLPELSPAIDDLLRIKTVLAPTKSCVVTCRNVYDINGESQQTEEYIITVSVPAFQDSAASLSGPLTKKLAQLQTPDKLQINRIIKKYFYNPESILEDSVDVIE